MTKNKVRREDKKENILLNITVGGLLGFVLFILFIILFAFVELKIGLGEKFYFPFLILVGSISGLMNGYVAVRPSKRCALPFGAASGCIESLLCLLVLLVSNKAFVGINSFVFLLIIVVFSAVGGVIAANLRLRKKY